jgi:hypothetical protein
LLSRLRCRNIVAPTVLSLLRTHKQKVNLLVKFCQTVI